MARFPRFRKAPLWLSGESFGVRSLLRLQVARQADGGGVLSCWQHLPWLGSKNKACVGRKDAINARVKLASLTRLPRNCRPSAPHTTMSGILAGSTCHRVCHMQGHYVPQLAQMIMDGNAKPGGQQLNLKGFLLGVHSCLIARRCLILVPENGFIVCCMSHFIIPCLNHLRDQVIHISIATNEPEHLHI